MDAGWTGLKRVVNGLSLHLVEAGPADRARCSHLLHGETPEFWWQLGVIRCTPSWRSRATPMLRGSRYAWAYNLSRSGRRTVACATISTSS